MEKVITKEINGVTYTAKFKGMAFKYMIESMLRAKASDYHITEILFSDILVCPKVTIDDFDTLDALDEVRLFLLDVALGDFEKPISDSKLKRQVDAEWDCWRLLCSDISNFDYNTVFYQMTPREIEKANIALDKVYKAIRSRTNK